MQQTKSYWRFVALAGVVTAFVASACVVTTSTDDDTAGSAGTSTAGASSAGASGAGAGGAGGAAAGAGGAVTAGAGGAAAVSYQCDDPNATTPPGTPGSCVPQDSTDACQVCIQSKCCAEYGACIATSPGNQCGWGGPNDKSEIVCVQDCIKKGVMDSGGVYDATLAGTCANECTTETTNGSSKNCGPVIGQQTNDLVGCLADNCQTECFTGPTQ